MAKQYRVVTNFINGECKARHLASKKQVQDGNHPGEWKKGEIYTGKETERLLKEKLIKATGGSKAETSEGLEEDETISLGSADLSPPGSVESVEPEDDESDEDKEDDLEEEIEEEESEEDPETEPSDGEEDPETEEESEEEATPAAKKRAPSSRSSRNRKRK